MVCTVCVDVPIAQSNEDCFTSLLKRLESHHQEQVRERMLMELEIIELKEALAKRESSSTSASQIHSPTLFSPGTSEIIDFGLEESLPPGPAGQLMPTSCSQETEIVCPNNTENVLPLPPGDFAALSMKRKFEESIVVQKKSSAKPHAPGWKVKPTNLSFSNLNNKTQICSPNKNKKQLLIADCLSKQQSPQLTRNPKKVIKSSPTEVINLTDDFHSTPKRKPLDLIKTTKEDRKAQMVLNESLDDFCDACRDYFIANPPKWTSTRQRDQKVRECAGHKAKKYQGHETPEGFWKVGFSENLPEQMKTQVLFKKK